MMGVYDASLRQVAMSSTMGADPCHIALSQDGKLLAAANYSSGSVALWTLNPATGLPTGRPAVAQHQGSGPDAKRQAGPHAHWVGFDRSGDILHSVDLGADAVFAHHIDRAAGRIAKTSIAYRAVAGSGPRHLVRHPRLPIAYLVAELANTVTVLRSGADGSFARRAEVSTLPAGFSGTSFAAHIAVNAAGTRLYVSNRGHDSIAVFAIGANGDLRLLQHVGCGGHWPRFFLLMEDRNAMLVANRAIGRHRPPAAGAGRSLAARNRHHPGAGRRVSDRVRSSTRVETFGANHALMRHGAQTEGLPHTDRVSRRLCRRAEPKAALQAWGTETDLFARGVAEQVTDAALMEEPLAHPGEIIRKTRGSVDDHLAALPANPKRKPADATDAHPPKPRRTKPAPRPSAPRSIRPSRRSRRGTAIRCGAPRSRRARGGTAQGTPGAGQRPGSRARTAGNRTRGSGTTLSRGHRRVA
ncbi:lactonase family protein [Sphingomonas sp. WKB10]|nr:lactonase family protein [Sphingomonas sp. WKB10]